MRVGLSFMVVFGGGGYGMWGRGLGFGSSLWFGWFGWFEASHFEIRDQLIRNLSEDRLSQRRTGSLKRETDVMLVKVAVTRPAGCQN